MVRLFIYCTLVNYIRMMWVLIFQQQYEMYRGLPEVKFMLKNSKQNMIDEEKKMKMNGKN